MKGFGIGSGWQQNGIGQAMKSACIQSKMEMVDYISASANSSIKFDRGEAMGIRDIWGKDIPVTSIKSMLGETLGASGVLSTISAVLSMRDNIVPPTVNYRQGEPECDIKIVREPVYKSIDSVMVNSIGLNAVSIILRRYLP